MPSHSRRQAKTMTAACKSAKFRKKIGIPKKTACDFHDKDRGKYHEDMALDALVGVGFRAMVMETIADDPHTNQQIETILSAYDSDTQAAVLDALEAVKTAGETGISISDWASYVRSIHGDVPVAEVLKIAGKQFPFIVRRIGDKRYGWVTSAGQGEEPFDSNVHNAIHNQVGATYAVQKMMTEKGDFTDDDLVKAVRSESLMRDRDALALGHHILQSFGGMVREVGPGRWRYVPQATKTTADHMQGFRDLVAKK